MRGLEAMKTCLIWPVLLAVAGCTSDPYSGYSAMSVFPDGISSVSVPIFKNETFVRDVEFELTDALIKEIEARSPYKVMSEARADTVLIGEIRKIELDQLSKSPLTGLSEEVIVSVTIDFERTLGAQARAELVAETRLGARLALSDIAAACP